MRKAGLLLTAVALMPLACEAKELSEVVQQYIAMFSAAAETPWRNYGSDEIRVWDPISCGVRFPRLIAQHGVFTVGRLPSTSPYRSAFDSELKEERGLLAEEVRSILSVSLKLCPSKPISPNATPPIGLTFRIHVNKESIRRSLSKRPGGPQICQNRIKIDHKLVYPDSDGMRTHSQFLIGLNKNTLVPP
jgi:hypothetical protein